MSVGVVVVSVEPLGPAEVVAVEDEGGADVVPPPTPHSSRLWPSSQHHTLPPSSFHAQ